MQNPFTILKRLHRTERGGSLVEFAVVLPAMVALGFGGLEGGNYIYKKHMIFNGVRDAARYVAGRLYDPTNVSYTNTLKTDAQQIALRGTLSGTTYRVLGWTSGVTVDFDTVPNASNCTGGACYRYQGDVPRVTVTATVNYADIDLGFLNALPFLNTGTVTITTSHQERVIGVR